VARSGQVAPKSQSKDPTRLCISCFVGGSTGRCVGIGIVSTGYLAQYSVCTGFTFERPYHINEVVHKCLLSEVIGDVVIWFSLPAEFYTKEVVDFSHEIE